MRILVATALLLFSTSVYSQNILTWDPTTDPRVETTEIDRCVGSTMQCAAAGATWVNIGSAPMPDTTFTDNSTQEGRTYNYKAYFANQDQGRGGESNVASKRLPFVAPPSDIPVLGVQ